MKYWKILIGISILLLCIGSAAAMEVKDFKTLDDYNTWDNNGYSNYTTNSDRYFLVEKVSSFDDDFKEDWFENHTENEYTVKPVGDNIFSIADNIFEFYGYQEVVEVDGENYMISINQNSKLSPSEETGFLEDLKEFNTLNNLKPVEI